MFERVGYAFNWNGHLSGAEDVEGILRDHPAVKDVMIAPIKMGDQNLNRLQVFIVLNQGHALDGKLRAQFDDLVTGKRQRTFKALMTKGAGYFPAEMRPPFTPFSHPKRIRIPMQVPWSGLATILLLCT